MEQPMGVTIHGKDYPMRDVGNLSLNDAMQGVDLSIKALAVMLRLQRNLPVDREKAIAAIISYFQYCLPSIKREVLEAATISERTVPVELQVELENKLIPFGIALLSRYPELQDHHDQRMREEGLFTVLENGLPQR
jgi:hypothetical protein